MGHIATEPHLVRYIKVTSTSFGPVHLELLVLCTAWHVDAYTAKYLVAVFHLDPLTIKYISTIKNTTTTPISTINFTFFHHIFLLSPRLLILKSCALPPSRSVLSTSKSILSPRSNTLSMFSVMMPLTLSISACALLIASAFPPSVVPYPTMSFFNEVLKSAAPYAGMELKSVREGSC